MIINEPLKPEVWNLVWDRWYTYKLIFTFVSPVFEFNRLYAVYFTWSDSLDSVRHEDTSVTKLHDQSVLHTRFILRFWIGLTSEFSYLESRHELDSHFELSEIMFIYCYR
jgi:hypothetical protein